MIAWPLNENLLPLLEDCGLNVYSAICVGTSVNVFTSIYVGVPFLHMLFGYVVPPCVLLSAPFHLPPKLFLLRSRYSEFEWFFSGAGYVCQDRLISTSLGSRWTADYIPTLDTFPLLCTLAAF